METVSKAITPEAVKVAPACVTVGWDYSKSVQRVKGMFISWKSVTEEMLEELWLAKNAITKGGKRKSGLPKAGEQSWSEYVKECFGKSLTKRTVDSYIKHYFENGKQKSGALTIKASSDHSKVVINSVKKEDDRIRLDLFLPEFNTHYIQYISA